MISVVCTKNGDLNALLVEPCLTAVVDHVIRGTQASLSSARWQTYYPSVLKYLSSSLCERETKTAHTFIYLFIYVCVYHLLLIHHLGG